MVADGYTKIEAGNLFQYFSTLTENLGGLVLAVLLTFALCPSLGRSNEETRWVQVNFTKMRSARKLRSSETRFGWGSL